MEIKTSFFPVPAALLAFLRWREMRAQELEGPGAAPQASLAQSWELQPPPPAPRPPSSLSPSPEEALRGGLWWC